MTAPMHEMAAHAAIGNLALQRCTDCDTIQYPPRELCAACLSDHLEWYVSDGEPGEVLATTTLHHSHDVGFHPRLPLAIALVRLDSGPRIVCFAPAAVPGQHVRVTASLDSQGRPILTACPA